MFFSSSVNMDTYSITSTLCFCSQIHQRLSHSVYFSETVIQLQNYLVIVYQKNWVLACKESRRGNCCQIVNATKGSVFSLFNGIKKKQSRVQI